MELRHLKYFRAVAEYRSVSKAAEALYITQPALSKVIARLETELGVPLFQREHGGMVPNVNGIHLLQCTNAMFAELDECMLDLKHGGQRHIRLATSNFYCLNSVFDKLQALHPNLRITYENTTTDQCLGAILSGNCNIAVTEVMDADAGEMERLHPLKWCVIAHRNHPIMSRRSVDVPTLAHELISVGNSRDKSFLEAQFRFLRLQYRPFLEPNSSRTALSTENYINRCMAIGVVPYDIFYTLRLPAPDTPIDVLPLILKPDAPVMYRCLECAEGFPDSSEERAIVQNLRNEIFRSWDRTVQFTEGFMPK